MRMTKEQQDRNLALAKALRSGNFVQGRGRLRFGDTFCCLGVACELYRQTTGKGKWEPSTLLYGFEYVFRTDKRSFGGLPPLEVSEFYGWNAENPVLKKKGSYIVTAVEANDSDQWTFEEIADAFEKKALDAAIVEEA